MRVLCKYDRFDSSANGWTTSSPGPDISPLFDVDERAGRTGGGALKIAADCSAAAIGCWKKRVDGLLPGHAYRITACYQATGIAHEPQSISLRLDWRDDKGQRPRQPDNAVAAARDGLWRKIDYTTLAPDRAQSVTIELELRWAPGGVVWWDEIELAELDAAPRRPVRIATVFHRPRNTASPADSVSQFCRLLDEAAPNADLVCLPEGITVIGTGQTYAQVAEPLPGPTTQTLGQLARKCRTNIVAGLYERAGHIVYNTSVLIDRTGQLIGTYRKTHLPQEEVEAGIAPGDCFPVFQTDVAKVGMIICWDVQFPEPARNLARNGAEIIALPIWGGSDVLARARAIENHIVLVSATYDMRSFIVDPTGKVLAEATKDQPLALASVDLAQPLYQPWLGDMKHRTWKESRPDLR